MVVINVFVTIVIQIGLNHDISNSNKQAFGVKKIINLSIKYPSFYLHYVGVSAIMLDLDDV